jgi:hypothetical protein
LEKRRGNENDENAGVQAEYVRCSRYARQCRNVNRDAGNETGKSESLKDYQHKASFLLSPPAS